MPPLTLQQVLQNITDPRNWIDPEELIQTLKENPSLRGMTYGYVSEQRFAQYLSGDHLQIEDHHKDDDHKKTKSDRTFRYKGRKYTVQLKSLQTNSIKSVEDGKFSATVQNDASDKRRVTLPDGTSVETTCYVVGEYDILAVSLQPFTGQWQYAFKKNKDLRRSQHKNYTESQKQHLLSTIEPIFFPIEANSGWHMDLLLLLEDTEVGKVEVVDTSPDGDVLIVTPPQTEEKIVVQESSDGNAS